MSTFDVKFETFIFKLTIISFFAFEESQFALIRLQDLCFDLDSFLFRLFFISELFLILFHGPFYTNISQI